MHMRVSDLPLGRRRRAFSLIELLTAVSIMLVIIYALYAMFNQTQKALRANITQVDVMEAGRAAAEMIGRELEQVSACSLSNTINLYAGMVPITKPPLTQMDAAQKATDPMLRTNIIQEFFFLSRQTNYWYGTGYRVIGADDGVGTLYRYAMSNRLSRLTDTNLMGAFVHQPAIDPATRQISTNLHRVADGIIHLRLTAYDPDGRRMQVGWTNLHPSYRILSLDNRGAKIGLYSTAGNATDANVILRADPFDPSRPPYLPQTQFSFISNALPGYIEVELGVLEPTALQRYKSLRESPAAATEYLRRQAGKVHLFRQRIPIRTALP